jgi:heterotetrameric sarcosine oxidase gamma subunit
MSVSAPESAPLAPPAVQLAHCVADIVQLSPRRGAHAELQRFASGHALALPPCGRVARATAGLVLAVRPERWLLLAPAAEAGASAAYWQELTRPCALAVDLSGAFALLYLAGAGARELLTRGCRLDLDPQHFAPGCAAATVIAQVPVTLAAVAHGLLLVTPASTARHLQEWLSISARPSGLDRRADVTVHTLSGDATR